MKSNQRKNGIWGAVGRTKLYEETHVKGYTVNSVEKVYAGSATLTTAN